jgi:hypothetical protein
MGGRAKLFELEEMNEVLRFSEYDAESVEDISEGEGRRSYGRLERFGGGRGC